MESYDRLLKKVNDCAADAKKAEVGNVSAGVRLRKAMVEIKKIAGEVNAEVLTKRQPQETKG